MVASRFIGEVGKEVTRAQGMAKANGTSHSQGQDQGAAACNRFHPEALHPDFSESLMDPAESTLQYPPRYFAIHAVTCLLQSKLERMGVVGWLSANSFWL